MARKPFAGFRGGVTFGSINIGVETASVGIKIGRGVINLNMADELFCGRRLTGKIILGKIDEGDGQGKLIDDVDHEVQGAFDVSKFSCNKKQIGITASFSLEDIDIAELSVFSSKPGRLVIDSVGEIPEPEKKEPPLKGKKGGDLAVSGPWRNVSLDELFDPEKTARKALANAGIDTVGQLADYTASGKPLTKIDGIGEGKATEISKRMEEFWAANPEAAEAATAK